MKRRFLSPQHPPDVLSSTSGPMEGRREIWEVEWEREPGGGGGAEGVPSFGVSTPHALSLAKTPMAEGVCIVMGWSRPGCGAGRR